MGITVLSGITKICTYLWMCFYVKKILLYLYNNSGNKIPTLECFECLVLSEKDTLTLNKEKKWPKTFFEIWNFSSHES